MRRPPCATGPVLASCAWVAVVLLACAPPARAAEGFAAAVGSACREGTAFLGAGMLAEAQASFAAVKATAAGRRCDERSPRVLLNDIRRRERSRARAIEVARASRITAQRLGPGPAARRYRDVAYAHYLKAFRLDPGGPGARRGLRALLDRYPGGAKAHCHRAQELLGLRLLREARLEYARGHEADGGESCRDVLTTLVERREDAFELTRQAMARARSGDGGGARRKLIAALAVDPASHGAVAALSRTSPPLPTKASPPAVLTRLEIGQRCEESGAGEQHTGTAYVPIRSVVTLDLERDDRDVRKLRAAQARNEHFWTLLEGLMLRFGLPNVDEEILGDAYNVQDRDADVDIAVRGARASVRIAATGTVTQRRRQFLWPWLIRPADRDVSIRLGTGRPPPGAVRKVEVAACGWALADATPGPPQDQGAGREWTLAWTLADGSLGPRPSVTLDIPPLDEWALEGASSVPTVRVALSLLLPFLLGAGALVVMLGLPGAGQYRAATVVVLVGLVLLAITWLLLFAGHYGTGWRVAFGVVPLLVLAAISTRLVAPSSWPGRVLHGITLIGALAGAVWIPIVMSDAGPQGDLAEKGMIATAVLMTFVTAYALLSATAAAVSVGCGRPVASWSRPLRLALVALAAAPAAQFVLQMHNPPFGRGLVLSERPDPDQTHWVEKLLSNAAWQPLNTLASAMPLLTVLAAGLALVALRLRRAQTRAQPVFPDRRSSVLARLLFVTLAVGSTAPLIGFPVPIALGLALIYLARFRSSAVEQADEHARASLQLGNQEPSALRTGRTELLDRAAGIVRELRIQDALRAGYAEGKRDVVPDASALSTKLDESRLRVVALTAGPSAGPPPVTVPLPVDGTPRAIALGVGPDGDWWENGVKAVRVGALIALFPIGFTTFVLLQGIVERAPWSLIQASPLAIVAGIAQEIAIWLVSAFTLGALLAHLPFRSSPAKGAILAGAFIAPVAVLHVITALLDAMFGLGRLFHLETADWTFRGFELLLFLMALGLCLDMASVRATTARLVPLYGLDDVRSALLYLAPVVATVILVGGQLFRGDATNAVQTLLESAGSFLPTGGVGGL